MYNAKVITFGDIRLCGCSFFSNLTFGVTIRFYNEHVGGCHKLSSLLNNNSVKPCV
jgi:hypothetical protein